LPSMMSTFFVPIGKEIGDCWGTEHLPVLWGRAFRKVVAFEKRARPERSRPRLFLSLSQKGRGSAAPNELESLSACLRLLRE
jgi:hypothetical protein